MNPHENVMKAEVYTKKTENIHSQENLFRKFTTYLLIIVKKWKQVPSTDEGVNKMYYLCNVMEYYPAIQRDEVMISTAT